MEQNSNLQSQSDWHKRYSFRGISSPPINGIRFDRRFSSEFEAGWDAEVVLGAIGIVNTGDRGNVFAIWGVWWYAPFKVVWDWVGVFGLSLMVLIVKWGSVPVDVNVDIVDIDGAAEATSEMKGAFFLM